MCVALAALDAVVHLEAAAGKRSVPLTDLHLLPGDTPHVETALLPGELITGVEIPPCSAATNSIYRKVRDRSSYAFALVSVAAALELDGGRIKEARLALGGVAHKPWRARRAEESLRGGPATVEAFRRAAQAEFAQVSIQPGADGGNAFKPTLATRTIVATLRDLVGDAR
jgi:xanthine dehydrogenase YagS FAD-binding subunit